MNQAAMMKIKKMQKEMMENQKRIEETVFTGTSAGIATVQMKGNHEVVDVKIEADVFESADDIDMINDAVKAAINDCIKQIDKAQEEAMGGFANMGLGGLF